MVAAVMVRLRRLRSIPTGVTPPPPAPTYETSLPRGDRLDPVLPTVAVLAARPDADAAALVLLLSRMFLTHGARPALLWTERTDTFAPGVVTTATSAALFPDRLQAAAETCHLARIAHVGPGGEAEAARCLFDDLATATHAILDGRMLGVVNATLGVFVVGDGMGVDPPLVRALRDSCDVEVNEPSVAVAEAILRALARRA
jgi:hypothetical protein